MRKAIGLVLLIVLGTMPLNASAQASVPSVDLNCTTDNDDGYLWIDTFLEPENESSGQHELTFECKVTNPNAYVERVDIRTNYEGLTWVPITHVSNGTIILESGGEESFNVTIKLPTRHISEYQLTVSAKVVEANGVPPPNTAESEFPVTIYASKDYKENGPNGCATFAENGMYQWGNSDWTFLVSMTIEHRTLWNRAGPEPDDWLNMNTHNVVFRINTANAYLHAANFYTLTTMGCYDDVPFHRVIDGFVIQGGDFETGNGTGGNAAFWAGYCNGQTADQNGTNYTAQTCPTNLWSLPLEPGNGQHYPGALAMARAASINSAGSQFYVIPSDSNPTYLDSTHTVFGEVVKGMRSIDYISEVETDSTDRPMYDVIVTKMHLADGPDSDGDGLPDDVDDYPNDANETEDSDGDGVGDNFDPSPYDPTQFGGDSDGDGSPDGIDDFPNDANETTDSDGDGVGDNSDAFPNDANETTDSDGDGVGDNSDLFPNDPDETHDDDGDGVGNNTDVFPKDPDEQYDKDGDGVGDNEDDFPDSAIASNWSTIYAAVGTLILLLIGAGVMVSRMKKEDELPNVPSMSEIDQIEKKIAELEKRKAEILGQQDLTESLFEE